MRLFKLSFKIGTKLALMSVLSIALVAAMIGISVWSGAEIKKAVSDATTQQGIATDLAEVIAGIRSTQVAVRDIRLSDRREEIQKYADQTEVRSASTADVLEKVIPKFKVPENRERAERIQKLFIDYAKAGKEIAKVKLEMLPLGDSPRRDTLGEHLHMLVNDRTVIVANQMISMSEEGMAIAKAT